MAVTAKWYGNGLLHIANGDVIWKASGGSDIRVALCTSSYTPNQDTHDAYDDLTNEVSSSGTGYTTGGAQLTVSDPTYDSATNQMRLDAADVTWSSSTITARYAIIYKYNATASLAYLLGYVDFGEDKVSSSGDFTITWDSTGVLRITAS